MSEACNIVDQVDLGLTDIIEFSFGLDLDSQNTSPFTSTEKDLGATQLKSVGRCELPKRELSAHADTVRIEETFTSRASEVKGEFPSPLHHHEHHSRAFKIQASKFKLESPSTPSPPHCQPGNILDGDELHSHSIHTERPDFEEDISMISDESSLPDASGDSGNKLFAPKNENNSNAESIYLSIKDLQDLGKARGNLVPQIEQSPKICFQIHPR